MTAKKEALVKQLASLAARHSASDWHYAAESLEEIARLARTLAELPIKRPARARVKRNASPREQNAAPDEVKFSPVTDRFAQYLTENIGSRAGPNLRDLANYLGMKSDLPKNASAIVEVMCRHLDGLPEDDRLRKIARAISFVEQRSPQGASHYDRWVSLITRK